MTEIEIRNIETNEKNVFKSLVDAAEFLEVDKATLSMAIARGSKVKKKYIAKKANKSIVIIEEYKPRIEGYDYQALRKHILSRRITMGLSLRSWGHQYRC